MTRRRANGQGSVFQRKDARWEASAYVVAADATSRRVSRYAGTRAQAEEKLAGLLAQNAQWAPATIDRTTTVGRYLTWWLDAVAVHRLRPTTLVTYRQHTDRYLIPGLGKHKLIALSTGHVQQWLTSLGSVCWCCTQAVDARRPEHRERCCALGVCCGSFLTAGTIAYLRAILSSALAHAVREDKLVRNVVAAVRLPGPGRSPDSPLTAGEAGRLLAAAKAHRLYALFRARPGLRATSRRAARAALDRRRLRPGCRHGAAERPASPGHRSVGHSADQVRRVASRWLPSASNGVAWVTGGVR